MSAPIRPVSPMRRSSARAPRSADVLIIDTAGRLQNKADLMAELAKIVRVLKKLDPAAPHSVVLVLDATTGQNALNQVQIFQEIAGVTSLVVTKLDGTARGGILVAIAERFGFAGERHRRRRGRRRSAALRRSGFRPRHRRSGQRGMKQQPDAAPRRGTARRGIWRSACHQARHRARAAARVLRRQCRGRHLCGDGRASWRRRSSRLRSPGGAITSCR